jgi:hypothetical protein
MGGFFIMNERDAINRIHDKKRKSNSLDRRTVHPWKVTDDFQAGVLDCVYINKRGFIASPVWIEYKYKKALAARDNTPFTIKWHSALQQEWANYLYDSGQTTLVITAFGEGLTAGAVILYDREWDNGITTAEARRRAMSLNSVATIINRIVVNDGEVTRFIKNFEGNLGHGG